MQIDAEMQLNYVRRCDTNIGQSSYILLCLNIGIFFEETESVMIDVRSSETARAQKSQQSALVELGSNEVVNHTLAHPDSSMERHTSSRQWEY